MFSHKYIQQIQSYRQETFNFNRLYRQIILLNLIKETFRDQFLLIIYIYDLTDVLIIFLGQYSRMIII